MKITIDTEKNILNYEDSSGSEELSLYSPAGFAVLSKVWVETGWDQKHSYGFSWFGRPLIQLPEDVLRIQEVIWDLKPDLIIETGVAHGGSLIFYASLCQAMGKGKVVGVDIKVRPHNREAIESHFLFERIKLIEGDSTDPDIVSQAAAEIRPGDTVLVILDSCHTRVHVAKELDAYHEFVTKGSYIVATDGIMQDLAAAPNGCPSWDADNPAQAARDFAAQNPDFELVQPPRTFSENQLADNITYWPDAWLKRL